MPPSRGRVALATSAALSALTDDDRLAAQAPRDGGYLVEAAVWDDPAVGWTAFDVVVLRSAWDYHLRLADFEGWIGHLEAEGVALWNPPAVVRWNAHKAYLLELAAAGVAVAPTVLLRRGESASLPELATRLGRPELIVKPAVSASAHRTALLDGRRAGDQATLTEAAAGADTLVQPFMQEVASEGEWSLIFLGGEFSHSVLKTPAPGDFRVQHELGGTARALPAPAPLLAEARAALRRVRWPTLYARIDLVRAGGRPVLMELELIEPDLFFGLAADAPRRFRDALAGR